MNEYTPEQLRRQADDAAWCLPDSGRYAEECRVHADALEKLKVAEEALQWIAQRYDDSKSTKACADDAYEMKSEAAAALAAIRRKP